MSTESPLSGRVVLLTGASGGIGAALARRLAEAGADVALTYSGHREEAEQAAAAAAERGARTMVIGADLAAREACVEVVERTRGELGEIDVLVANAGMGVQRRWDEVDADLWDATMAVNARAPFLLASATLPGMVQRGWGRVLFVSSIAALNGGVVGPHYAASKAALHGLTHHLAPRVASSGVTVNALAPALIGDTRMVPTDPDAPGELPAPIPVGRLGEPAEVADMALAVLRNGYVTNTVVTVDGGLVAR